RAFIDELAELRSVDQLERQIVGLIDPSELIDRNDVGVGQSDCGFGLGHKKIDELATSDELLPNLLEAENFLKTVGTDQLGTPNDCHAALGQALLQEILAEDFHS